MKNKFAHNLQPIHQLMGFSLLLITADPYKNVGTISPEMIRSMQILRIFARRSGLSSYIWKEMNEQLMHDWTV